MTIEKPLNGQHEGHFNEAYLHLQLMHLLLIMITNFYLTEMLAVCVLYGAQLPRCVWADHLHGIFRHQPGHQGDALKFRFTRDLQTGLTGQITSCGLGSETL